MVAPLQEEQPPFNLFMKKLIRTILTHHITWLIALSVVFFFAVSSFNFTTQDANFVKWLSPDETANYILTKLYGQEGSLTIYEKYNLYVDDVMRPRSFRSDHGTIKPVSFLGIILIFGTIVKFTTFKIIPYLTPLLASIGIIYYYLLVGKLFNKNIALVSSVLLAFFPVYTYYSARSMFHNVLFTVFLIIGFYYSLMMVDGFRRRNLKERSLDSANASLEMTKVGSVFSGFPVKLRMTGVRGFFSLPPFKNYLYLLYSALAGFFVGLAVIGRTSELMWLTPVFIVLWIFNFRKVGILKLAFFVGFFLLSLLPMFYYNQILYSNPLLGGYSEMNQSIINIREASSDIVKSTLTGEVSEASGPFELLKESIFYFGLQPGQSFLRFQHYFVYMFPWIFWPALLGGLILLYRAVENWRKKYFLYILSYFIISFILLIYYGSWGFTDNPDPNSFTIGNSYTRYWLPVYLGAFPFVSILVLSLGQFIAWPFSEKLKENKFINFRVRKNYIKWGIVAVFLSIVSILSIQFVLYGSEEGLIYVAQNQVKASAEARKVLDLTESNSVIITLYHDKLLFPERKVVVGLFDDKAMIERYSRMVEYLPVYYYNFTLPQKDVDYLNSRRLAEFGLGIKEVQKVTGDFTLYRLFKVDNIQAR